MTTGDYDVIFPLEGRKKGKDQMYDEVNKTPPTSAEGKEFRLSKCEAYEEVVIPPVPTVEGEAGHPL